MRPLLAGSPSHSHLDLDLEHSIRGTRLLNFIVAASDRADIDAHALIYLRDRAMFDVFFGAFVALILCGLFLWPLRSAPIVGLAMNDW
jgi:hypothetical protein